MVGATMQRPGSSENNRSERMNRERWKRSGGENRPQLRQRPKATFPPQLRQFASLSMCESVEQRRGDGQATQMLRDRANRPYAVERVCDPDYRLDRQVARYGSAKSDKGQGSPPAVCASVCTSKWTNPRNPKESRL
jgi:hypothetical protein